MIYGPYRTHATRGIRAGTQPTPWDEETKKRGLKDVPHTPGLKQRFAVMALERALLAAFSRVRKVAR